MFLITSSGSNLLALVKNGIPLSQVREMLFSLYYIGTKHVLLHILFIENLAWFCSALYFMGTKPGFAPFLFYRNQIWFRSPLYFIGTPHYILSAIQYKHGFAPKYILLELGMLLLTILFYRILVSLVLLLTLSYGELSMVLLPTYVLLSW